MFQAYKKHLDKYSSDYVAKLADNATQLLLHAASQFPSIEENRLSWLHILETVPAKVFMQLGHLYRDHYQDDETSIRYYEECLKRENNDKEFELFVKRVRAGKFWKRLISLEQDITESEKVIEDYRKVANVNSTNLTEQDKEM